MYRMNWSRCIMHRRRSIVNRSSLVPLLHTDLPREQDRSLLTLGVPQLCGALLQGLGLLRCEGKLEAFLLRNFITFNFRQLDRPVFTLPLWYRIANCYSSLSCVYNRYIVADLVLDSLAISLVSIPSILLLRTHLLSFFLTLSLVLHLNGGGLSLLGLLVVDVVAHLIVHQLLSVQTVLTTSTQSSLALMERVFTLTFWQSLSMMGVHTSAYSSTSSI